METPRGDLACLPETDFTPRASCGASDPRRGRSSTVWSRSGGSNADEASIVFIVRGARFVQIGIAIGSGVPSKTLGRWYCSVPYHLSHIIHHAL